MELALTSAKMLSTFMKQQSIPPLLPSLVVDKDYQEPFSSTDNNSPVDLYQQPTNWSTGDSTFWSAMWLHSSADLLGTCVSPEDLFYMSPSLKCRGSKFARPFQRENTQCKRLTKSEHTSAQIPCWNIFIKGEERDSDAEIYKSDVKLWHPASRRA